MNKVRLYITFLNIMLFSILGGSGYFIWRLSDGLPTLYKIGFVVAAFGLGAILAVLSNSGFGAVPVRIVNPPEDPK